MTPAASRELTRLNLAEASELVRTKQISPVELTETSLKRIDELNPVLNAFITVTAETAMGQARELEAELARGVWRGPLHGIPIGIKDLIDTAGIRTTAASAVYENRVPSEDAETVRRLKEAGAVLVGKLNLHEFAFGGTSGVSHFGAVKNPWNPAFSPGGSSGGSAAAVAAGMCFGALGTDTAASIRMPAACCGIVGLKPTYGRVSTRGVIPLSWSLDHVGPMCRTVEDTAILLQAIAGFDAEESTSLNAPVPPYRDALSGTPSRLRLGVPRKLYFEDLEPDTGRAVEEAIRVLAGITASIQDVDLPRVEALTISEPEAFTFHEANLATSGHLYSAPIRERLLNGSKVPVAAYIRARREMERWRRNTLPVFSAVDLLVMPTVPVKPPPAGSVSDFNLIRNTSAFNVYGIPTVSVPCGFTTDGLPIGLQIAAPHLEEEPLLLAAHAYEQAARWHRQAPRL